MHNLKANIDNFLALITHFAQKMVNARGNIIRRGVVPKFSDVEVVALSLCAEALGIDSENFLFGKLA